MGIKIIWTELSITEFNMKHEEITASLGIIPREAYNKGDLLTVGKKKVRQITAEVSNWEIRSDSDLIEDGEYTEMVEAHINNILEKIRPVKDKFLEITKDCKASMEMIIEFYEWTSYIEVRKNISKQLAEFNIDLFFSVYYMKDPETEE